MSASHDKPADAHDHSHDGEEYSRFHLDVHSLLNHLVNGGNIITPEEDKAMESPQQPDAFLISCIDSRFQPDRALDYGPGVTLEYRPISAVIPPEAEADAALLARMAFRRLKDVGNIILIAHSDCGGAQAAIDIPDPDIKNGGDLDIVAAESHRTGLDIAALSAQFKAATRGDKRAAGNMLAKEIAIQSMKNIMGYKGRTGFATIADEIAAAKASAALLYYDLDSRSVQQYDMASQKWETVFMPPAAPKNTAGANPAAKP